MNVHDYELADLSKERVIPFVPYISVNIGNINKKTTDEELFDHFANNGYEI